MPSKTWGTPQTATEFTIVSETTEIPDGESAYVFTQDGNPDGTSFSESTWNAFLNGDLTELKSQIEIGIPNTEVQFIRLHWDSAMPFTMLPSGETWFLIKGMKIEAMVKNIGGAGLGGWEIIGIILASALLAVVIAGIIIVAWVVWKIVTSVNEVNPILGAGLGLIIVVILLIFLFGILGGSGAVSRGKGGTKASFAGRKR